MQGSALPCSSCSTPGCPDAIRFRSRPIEAVAAAPRTTSFGIATVVIKKAASRRAALLHRIVKQSRASHEAIRRRDRSGERLREQVSGGVLAAARLLLVLALQELDVHLGAVDAHELAAAIGQTRRRQQQEELLEVKP